ncbi:MAG: hypothetical protein Q8P60_15655, partial [Pseudorhodobacter sp.]|nr:hypothetical protein [Pseudorhodobacter sp.]
MMSFLALPRPAPIVLWGVIWDKASTADDSAKPRKFKGFAVYAQPVVIPANLLTHSLGVVAALQLHHQIRQAAQVV